MKQSYLSRRTSEPSAGPRVGPDKFWQVQREVEERGVAILVMWGCNLGNLWGEKFYTEILYHIHDLSDYLFICYFYCSI